MILLNNACVLLSSYFAIVEAAAVPATPPASSSSCTNPSKRPEWRALSQAQKTTYITAVQCLTTKPSRLGLTTSLYEDFAYVHAHLNTEIHFNAKFLPWHRYFTSIYESALRNDCTYTGPFPYWDWVQDNAAPSESPIWSPTSGFGGNGNGTGFQSPSRPSPLIRCVTDGPFKSLRPTYRQTTVEPHCLNRAWNDGIGSNPPDGIGRMQGAAYAPAVMANITAKTTFVDFWQALENGPHGAVHQGISGDMGPSTSPNDPVFFVHHAQIDRLWEQWRQADLEARAMMFGGNNADGSLASLNDVLPMMGLAKDVRVEDVMSTTAGEFCYGY